MDKISAQTYADRRLAPEYRQPLKTVQAACSANGWEFEERPKCCGEKVKIESFIGAAYFAECKKCGKFIADVTGPSFGNSWVNCVDSDKVDITTEELWIAGVAPESERGPA